MKQLTNSELIVRCSRILLCLTILISFKKSVLGQINFVLNPGMEQYWRCPDKFDEIKFANYWQSIDTVAKHGTDTFGNYNCTPEYCNKCAGNNPFAGVPFNSHFNHYPHTGNGMAQVMTYNIQAGNDPYRRDYLQGTLKGPLIANKSYCVSFYVVLETASDYAINHLGAYLDNGLIDTVNNCGSPQTAHIPQIRENNIIYDTLNWTKIEGSFVANGTEKYITIGNFSDNAHTDTSTPPQGRNHFYETFYLVDDVSVVESDIPAYAGGTFFKAKKDSVFIGRNEIVPDCTWYRNGVLIDTLHAGFWVRDTANATYVVKQTICGLTKYDTAHVYIAKVGVGSVGNESIYKLYPNPATKEIVLQAPNNTSSAELAIYDMSGKVMMRRMVEFVGGEVRVPIDLRGGVYVVELVREGIRNLQRLCVL